MKLAAVLLAVLLGLVSGAAAYSITVAPHQEECFYEYATQDTRVGVMFQVTHGGALDIDISISGPDGNSIYFGQKESDGNYFFVAPSDGRYQFCFSNKMSALTEKDVTFTLTVGDADLAQNAGETDVDKYAQEEDLGEMVDYIKQLTAGIYNVRNEVRFMQKREKLHRDTNESTNSRVLWWSVFEVAALVVMSAGQIFYLKRFFEVRRVV